MLGDAKRKIQRIVDLAEKLYEKVNELSRRVEDTTETVEDTNARLGDLESELADQRAILDALAEERGLDVDALTGGDREGATEESPDAGEELSETATGAEDETGSDEEATEA